MRSASRAKAVAENFEESCRVNDEKITKLKVDVATKEEAFKNVKENLQNSLKDHVKNNDDFLRLGDEKSLKIKELKALIIDLEPSLR